MNNEAQAVFCTYSEMVFSLVLPGPVCDEPAEGKRKGRPKAEVQELRSIPVSISLSTEWVFEVAFIPPAQSRQLPMNMHNKLYRDHPCMYSILSSSPLSRPI